MSELKITGALLLEVEEVVLLHGILALLEREKSKLRDIATFTALHAKAEALAATLLMQFPTETTNAVTRVDLNIDAVLRQN